ncbi:MAG: hypothetical protein IPJ41_12685 [Phycisphaerales bacterium]|nr:hypothetical protein [Phycisphaerales bacterium]
MIRSASPVLASQPLFNERGEKYDVHLRVPPKAEIHEGDGLFYGANPNGFMLAGGSRQNPQGQAEGVTVKASEGSDLVLELRGDDGPIPTRPPTTGDQVFLTPTEVNLGAAALYAVLPNFQHYWLIDAVAMNSPIPPRHLGLLAAYAATQILACLGLGIALFQTRDVG